MSPDYTITLETKALLLKSKYKQIGKYIKTLVRFWSYKIYNEKINTR